MKELKSQRPRKMDWNNNNNEQEFACMFCHVITAEPWKKGKEVYVQKYKVHKF